MSASRRRPDAPEPAASIQPDTKDWTWVLDRACPECGYDSSSIVASGVAERVRRNGSAWQVVLEASDVSARPHPTQWSPLEYACHVRDVCALYLVRLELMLTEDDPLFANWDQDATAVERRYDHAVPVEVAEELLTASHALAATLDSVRGTDWLRTGRRSDSASFTIESFSRYLLHDLVHHLWDVSGRRS
jgi:hypothetical protein